jgi:predicted Zn-dependent protease
MQEAALDNTLEILKKAADLRLSANRARRLSLQVTSIVDQDRLRSYATELEDRAAALEKRARQLSTAASKLTAEERAAWTPNDRSPSD